jgi:allantoinase
MSTAPAALAGLANQAGEIAAGRDANFVVFDPDASLTIETARLHYRHLISPYLGETLFGVVKATYLRGEAVFADNAFIGAPRGRELALS